MTESFLADMTIYVSRSSDFVRFNPNKPWRTSGSIYMLRLRQNKTTASSSVMMYCGTVVLGTKS